jgi:midasin
MFSSVKTILKKVGQTMGENEDGLKKILSKVDRLEKQASSQH